MKYSKDQFNCPVEATLFLNPPKTKHRRSKFFHKSVKENHRKI